MKYIDTLIDEPRAAEQNRRAMEVAIGLRVWSPGRENHTALPPAGAAMRWHARILTVNEALTPARYRESVRVTTR
jgi:hypothetical protein